MLTLHQSLGDWTHVSMVEEGREDWCHDNLSGHLSSTLDRLDARSSWTTRLGWEVQYRQRKLEREILALRKRLRNPAGLGISLTSRLCLLHQGRECGTGDFHTSTKLNGYIWIAGNEKVKHIPGNQTATVGMEDHDEDADEELEFMPRLQVFVRPQEEKGVCSQEREETQPEEVIAWWNLEEHEADVLPDAHPSRTPEDRHGQFLLRQLKPEHRRILHEITLTGQNVLRGDDLEGGQPLQRGDISYFSLLLMMTALAHAEFKTCMDYYAPAMGYEISYDEYHEFKLEIGRVLQENEHIPSDNFLDVEEPDLVDDDPETPLPDLQGQSRVDPEYKGTIESLNVEDKHIILESDDDKLVECTLQWISMCNKNVQKKIKERVVKEEAKQEEEEDEEIVVEEEEQDTQEPHVPPGSSYEKEEPVPPECSSEKEESGEKKADIQNHDTAGNEEDSAFRKLKDCFTDGCHGEWAGFYNQGYPASSKHRHMFWHVKYRKTMSPHQDFWYHLTDEQLMTEYIARHKDQQPSQELDELKNNIEYGCSDPRMHPLHQGRSEEASKEAERRIDDAFGNLTGVLQSYVEEHKVLPYCMILHSLASRYLGGGLLDPTHTDEEFPYRSSPQITMMFWNLGNWCRNRFEKCPVPERFQQLIPHIDYSLDEDHEQVRWEQDSVQQLLHQCYQKLWRTSLSWIVKLVHFILAELVSKRYRCKLASMTIMIWWLLLA